MPISKQVVGLLVGAVVVATGACNKGGSIWTRSRGHPGHMTRQDGVVRAPFSALSRRWL